MIKYDDVIYQWYQITKRDRDGVTTWRAQFEQGTQDQIKRGIISQYPSGHKIDISVIECQGARE